MEALVHETVHSLKGNPRRASIEEECDCFVAGLQAAAVAAGEVEPGLFRVDGRPVAEFVRERYPKARASSAYEPVGVDRAWLATRAGL